MQYCGIRPVFMKTSHAKPETMKRLLLFLLLPLVLGACDNDDESRTEIWTIAPEKGVTGIATGFGHVPAYIVRKGENAPWTTTAARIEGFTFERGYQTTLRVRIDPIANPPADATNERYTMEELLSRTASSMPVDPQTLSPEYEVLIASERPAGEASAYWIRDLRYGDDAPWQTFPWEIKGFDFTPGHEYQLLIQPVAEYDEEANGQTDDEAWTVKYRLKETILDEEKVSEGLPE